jgi:multiple sugar transport system ATP-binding protein
VATVSFDSVAKVFEDGTHALDDFSLEVADGEFLVLVGPSGCGKTTALRLVAGLESPTRGSIAIDGARMNGRAAADRDIAMVFQSYALYPHMTVAENIGFGLRMRGTPKREIRQRVEEIGRTLGLEEVMHRRPRALSGGQRQRVAMGRAIVRRPSVFLMDEPLSNLDAALRVQMRAEIARIQRQLGTTTIYVTHDQLEAMTMADRVAVLRRGRLQQVGTPQEIYSFPANLFVASFIGSPAMNLMRADVTRTGAGISCIAGDNEVVIPDQVLQARPGLYAYAGKEVALGIRPEHLKRFDDRLRPGLGGSLRGTLMLAEVLGSETLAHVEIAAAPVVTTEVLDVARDVDIALLTGLESSQRDQRTTIIARVEDVVAKGLGQEIAIAVDPSKVYFFDTETGSAIT